MSSLVLFLVLWILIPLANATNDTWSGAGGTAVWSSTSNWNLTSGGQATVVPGSGDTALFNSNGNGHTSVTVNNSISLGSLSFDQSAFNGATGYDIIGNGMTLSANGSIWIQPTFSGTGITETIENLLTLSGSHTFGNGTAAASNNQLLFKGNITNNTASTLNLSGSGSGTISGSISNGGGVQSLLVSGGMWTLSGNNTFTGPVTVSAGTLVMNGTNAFTGALTVGGGLLNATTAGINGGNVVNGITFNGGTLQGAPGGITTAKAVTMTGPGTIDTSFGDVSLSGALGGTGTLTKNGAGTLVLGGSNNAYTGGVTINNGTVQLANNNPNVNALTSGTLTFGASNTPTLDLNSCSASVGAVSALYSGGHPESNGVITNNALSGTGTLEITVASGTTQFCPAIMDGPNGGVVAVVKTGTGTLYLEGYGNDFSGGITINNGTVLGSNNGIRGERSVGSGPIIFASGVVTTATTTNPTLDLGGIYGGSVTLLAGSDTNGLVIATAGAATLMLANPGTATFAGSIQQSGTGPNVIGLLMAATAGTQILTGSSNFTGIIQLNGGILNATNAAINASSTTNSIVFNNGTLQSGSGGISTGKAIAITAQYFGAFDTNGSSITLSGVVSGGGTLIKTGSGALTVTGTNTFTGAWDLNGGILNATNAALNSANTSNGIVCTGGTLQAGADGISTAKPVLLSSTGVAAGTFDTNSMGTSTLSGVISGPGGFVKTGTDTLVLAAVNSYTGPTTINAGTLALGANGSISGSPLIDVKDGAIVDATARSFTMLSSQTFKFTLNGTSGLVGRLNAGTLNISSGIVDFVTLDTLSSDPYVVATYAVLTGTSFSSVLDLPTGYSLNYNYHSGNQIALVKTVPEPGAWNLLVGGIGLLVFSRRMQRRWAR